MEIKDRDLEKVNGSFAGSDYDIKYENDNEWKPDEPIEPGTYMVDITAKTLSMKQKILPDELDIDDIERYRQG